MNGIKWGCRLLINDRQVRTLEGKSRANKWLMDETVEMGQRQVDEALLRSISRTI